MTPRIPLPVLRRGRGRGRWTQIFGGKASEPETSRPVEKTQFLFIPLAFGAPVGGNHIEIL